MSDSGGQMSHCQHERELEIANENTAYWHGYTSLWEAILKARAALTAFADPTGGQG